MEILKETSFDAGYIGKVTLENGTFLYVNEQGFADGTDGKRYVGVFSEDEHAALIPIGWTSDASETVIV